MVQTQELQRHKDVVRCVLSILFKLFSSSGRTFVEEDVEQYWEVCQDVEEGIIQKVADEQLGDVSFKLWVVKAIFLWLALLDKLAHLLLFLLVFIVVSGLVNFLDAREDSDEDVDDKDNVDQAYKFI